MITLWFEYWKLIFDYSFRRPIRVKAEPETVTRWGSPRLPQYNRGNSA